MIGVIVSVGVETGLQQSQIARVVRRMIQGATLGTIDGSGGDCH